MTHCFKQNVNSPLFRTLIVTLFAALVSGNFLVTPAFGQNTDREELAFDENDQAVHLFVVRRALDIPVVPRVRYAAHSALLLKTSNDRYYLLEYMADAKVHLNRVEVEVKQEKDDHVVISMQGRADNGMKTFEWTRQLKGSKIEQQFTVGQLRDKMRELMPNGYAELKEDCHTAQERLRQAIGHKVD